jgi:hypothetical protein
VIVDKPHAVLEDGKAEVKDDTKTNIANSTSSENDSKSIQAKEDAPQTEKVDSLKSCKYFHFLLERRGL